MWLVQTLTERVQKMYYLFRNYSQLFDIVLISDALSWPGEACSLIANISGWFQWMNSHICYLDRWILDIWSKETPMQGPNPPKKQNQKLKAQLTNEWQLNKDLAERLSGGIYM